MPPQDTQYDETLVEYKNDEHAEVALSVNLYELNKDWPLPGQYEFSIPIVVAANSRRNMEYYATYGTGDIYIYDVHTLTLGDNEGVWVDLGYNTPFFWFYGAWYTKVFITSNGFVTFDSRAYNDDGGKWTSPNPTSIPTTDDPNIIIAPFWRDLDPSKGGTIEYGMGLSGDFAVVWRNVPNKANSNTQTFALYFSTIYPEISYIAFIYGSITNDVPTSIGIEDQTGKQGEPVASMSSGELVEFTDYLVDNNYYRITNIKVSMSKLTVDGVNDEKAIIRVQGWDDSRPGGTNVILEDPSEGKYDVPQIVKTAAFALGTAGLLTGNAYLGAAGYVMSAAIFACELSPMPRGTTVQEAMESTQTAYVKSAARDETHALLNYDHACDVSISPLILWQIKEPDVHRLLINAEVTVEKPDGTTYTLTTDNIELKLFYNNNAPNTPSTPSGPTSGYVYTTYSYSTSTIDPDEDNVRYQFEFSGPIPTISFMTGWYASGQTGSLTVRWETTDPPGTYQIRVRAQDFYEEWSCWSPYLTVTIVNRAPNTPSTPSGPTSGYTGTSYTYSTSTTDPDGDKVKYQFSWGDNTYSTTGYYNSGVTVYASNSWSSTGYKYVKVRACDVYGVWSGWSSSLTVYISSGGGGGGGCPTLFVWDGTVYVEEGILDIHAESDITVYHEIQNTLALENGVYKVQLRELDNFTSHIDQVKLYAVDYEGEWHSCPLTYAYHSELGKVKHTLKLDDDTRVDLAPTETIDLEFAQPIPYSKTAYFIFEINGYNAKPHPM